MNNDDDDGMNKENKPPSDGGTEGNKNSTSHRQRDVEEDTNPVMEQPMDDNEAEAQSGFSYNFDAEENDDDMNRSKSRTAEEIIQIQMRFERLGFCFLFFFFSKKTSFCSSDAEDGIQNGLKYFFDENTRQKKCESDEQDETERQTSETRPGFWHLFFFFSAKIIFSFIRTRTWNRKWFAFSSDENRTKKTVS